VKKHCLTCLLWSGKHCKHNPVCEEGVLEHWVPDKSNPAFAADPTNPQHYRDYPVEVIQLVRHLNFNRGNAVKYLCRAGKKDDELQDLRKALWYVQDEIQRLTGEGDHAKP
jgi:hypothetical protein